MLVGVVLGLFKGEKFDCCLTFEVLEVGLKVVLYIVVLLLLVVIVFVECNLDYVCNGF